MPLLPSITWRLEQEARALLTRLAHVQPFAVHEPMLPAAALLPEAQIAIERFLVGGRRHLRTVADGFIEWLHSPQSAEVDAEEGQRRLTTLRLRFNRVLTHFDLFDNVITQRSESNTGVWLSGMDDIAADALRLKGGYYKIPPIICYLDRGIGGAIRRARTRLPGGGANPVAIIKIPRERMVGSGIGASLLHEVGHQAAALLGLVESLRPVLQRKVQEVGAEAIVWRLWERWISEIVADLWAVARGGVGSTLGLINVVSLPRPFVFRVNPDDPHPVPWIRVKLSAALGAAIYPQSAWVQIVAMWESCYPIADLDPTRRNILARLENTIPELVRMLLSHRPDSFCGQRLIDSLDTKELQPLRLRMLLRRWRSTPQEMYRARPIVAFAAIGQGRADGNISPEEESTVIGKLLAFWALRTTLAGAATCSSPSLAGESTYDPYSVENGQVQRPGVTLCKTSM